MWVVRPEVTVPVYSTNLELFHARVALYQYYTILFFVLVLCNDKFVSSKGTGGVG